MHCLIFFFNCADRIQLAEQIHLWGTIKTYGNCTNLKRIKVAVDLSTKHCSTRRHSSKSFFILTLIITQPLLQKKGKIVQNSLRIIF